MYETTEPHITGRVWLETLQRARDFAALHDEGLTSQIPVHLKEPYTLKLSVRWLENVSFIAQTESNHAIVMDGAPEGGGRNLGPRPMETVLAGTGGCTAYDVITILRKARQPVRECVVEIDAERAPQDPKVFTRIHFHFVVTGEGVDPKQLERAIQLSAEKYCSASIMLAKTAQITHDFEVRPG